MSVREVTQRRIDECCTRLDLVHGDVVPPASLRLESSSWLAAPFTSSCSFSPSLAKAWAGRSSGCCRCASTSIHWERVGIEVS